MSKKMQPAELNYDTHDKELLAIIESLKGWRHYTMETSTPFEIITDHNNLKYFMTSKSLQFLSDFNFTLSHRPGKENIVADALSRREQDELDIGDRQNQRKCLLPPHLFAVIDANVQTESTSYTHIEKMLREAYQDDQYYNDGMQWMNDYGNEHRSRFPPGSGKMRSYDGDLDANDHTDQGFHVNDDLLFYEEQLYVPEKLRLVIMNTTRPSRDILVRTKLKNWSEETTGGQRCIIPSSHTSSPVIHVRERSILVRNNQDSCNL